MESIRYKGSNGEIGDVDCFMIVLDVDGNIEEEDMMCAD